MGEAATIQRGAVEHETAVARHRLLRMISGAERSLTLPSGSIDYRKGDTIRIAEIAGQSHSSDRGSWAVFRVVAVQPMIGNDSFDVVFLGSAIASKVLP